MNKYFVWKGIGDNSSRNKRPLVYSEYANKRPKEQRFIFGPDSGGSFNGVTARWYDRIVASEDILELVLIFSSLDEKSDACTPR